MLVFAFVAVVAMSFASCDQAAQKASDAVDSCAAAADTAAAVVEEVVDSAAATVDSAAAVVDSVVAE